jgi:hypothetical protein
MLLFHKPNLVGLSQKRKQKRNGGERKCSPQSAGELIVQNNEKLTIISTKYSDQGEEQKIKHLPLK